MTRTSFALWLTIACAMGSSNLGCNREVSSQGARRVLEVDDGASDGAATQVLVKAGAQASLKLATGAEVTVPEGALDKQVKLGLERPDDSKSLKLIESLDKSQKIASAPYVVTPHGTSFKRDVEVELPIAQASAGKSLDVRWLADESDTEWKKLGKASIEGAKAKIKVDHFSVLILVESDALEQPADAGAAEDAEPLEGSTQPAEDAVAPLPEAGDALSDAGTTAPDVVEPAPDAPIAVACATGSFDHDGLPATACVPWTDCTLGEYVREAGSGTLDRTCASCPAGSFSAAPNALVCNAWKSCAPGSFVSTEPSAQNDRSCTACAAGTQSLEVNAVSCQPIGACPLGMLETAPATATTPASCEACAAGFFCPGGPQAEQCADARWDDDADASTPCVPHRTCSAGEFVAAAGSATQDRSCGVCPGGSFSAIVNAASCSLWRDCAPGEFVAQAGSTTSDRSCAACATGSFSSVGNASACSGWSSCPPGTFVTRVGSALVDRACAACGS
ncbi:MAG TPA: hypothetical protein VFZ61_19290, partial [Polyangiales bacterium]